MYVVDCMPHSLFADCECDKSHAYNILHWMTGPFGHLTWKNLVNSHTLPSGQSYWRAMCDTNIFNFSTAFNLEIKADFYRHFMQYPKRDEIVDLYLCFWGRTQTLWTGNNSFLNAFFYMFFCLLLLCNLIFIATYYIHIYAVWSDVLSKYVIST
jgi:hypothetical protein